MLLENLTWIETRDYIENVSDCMIIPIGTCEQHGHHLPLNTDIVIIEYLAQELSNATGALIAPTVNYGINMPCDINLAGTTSLTEETLRNTILNITEWWSHQGFRKFLLLTYHGHSLHLKAMSDLGDSIKLYNSCRIDYTGILDKQDGMVHGCEAETSIMLYLFPGKVDLSKAVDCDVDRMNPEFRACVERKTNVAPDWYVGNFGYPSAATNYKGQEIYKKTRQEMFENCLEFLKS